MKFLYLTITSVSSQHKYSFRLFVSAGKLEFFGGDQGTHGFTMEVEFTQILFLFSTQTVKKMGLFKK